MRLANDRFFGERFHPKQEPKSRMKRQITGPPEFFKEFGPPSYRERIGK